MNEIILEKIKDFVAEFCLVEKDTLTSDTQIADDLRVDGDDAAELIEEFSKRFDVDLSSFDFSKHFGEEGFSLLSFFYYLIFDRNKSRFTPVTLRDLVKAVENKKWCL